MDRGQSEDHQEISASESLSTHLIGRIIHEELDPMGGGMEAQSAIRLAMDH